MFIVKPNQQQIAVSGRQWMQPRSLLHSAGIITALVGTKTYTATLGALSANTRYQIYIVPGSTTLQVTTRENSLGPVGFSNWILIGSFYANGLSPVAFGKFITIYDTPSTETIPALPIFSGAGAITIGNGVQSAWWSRSGDVALVRFNLLFGTTTSIGVGAVDVEMPSGMSMDTNKKTAGDHMGNWKAFDASAALLREGFLRALGVTFRMTPDYNGVAGTTDVTNTVPFAWTTGDSIEGFYQAPVTGWTTTPIKDL